MYVQQLQKSVEISDCAKGILQTLLYYDLFSYPLTPNEIHRSHPQPFVNRQTVAAELNELVRNNLVYENDGLFGLQASEKNFTRRKAGNQLAQTYLKRARQLSRIISQVPYIRHISLSGSISKGYMEKGSDIDYFIITAPGRLWLARTILALLKKIFFLNSHKYLCINYFVDDEHLEITEKNIFTAKEIATLIPVYNSKKFAEFNWENNWTYEYFPNTETDVKHVWEKSGSIKNFGEKVLSRNFGDVLDNFCMNLTMRYWRTKHRHSPFIHGAIRCNKWEAKYHPQHFQKTILEKYKVRIAQFESEHTISLS